MWLTETLIAHRGLHSGKEIPENSLASFMCAIEKGFAIEIDVHLSVDGTVVVYHDDSLERLTKGCGYIWDHTWETLSGLQLYHSGENIPSLQQTLALVAGRVPLLIELKNFREIGPLEQKVVDILSDYTGEYAVQSFNPKSVAWFKNHAPHILRGQLAGGETYVGISWWKKTLLNSLILNRNSEPHFIGYWAEELPNFFVSYHRNRHAIPVLAWTVRDPMVIQRNDIKADNFVFENFLPETWSPKHD